MYLSYRKEGVTVGMCFIFWLVIILMFCWWWFCWWILSYPLWKCSAFSFRWHHIRSWLACLEWWCCCRFISDLRFTWWPCRILFCVFGSFLVTGYSDKTHSSHKSSKYYSDWFNLQHHQTWSSYHTFLWHSFTPSLTTIT